MAELEMQTPFPDISEARTFDGPDTATTVDPPSSGVNPPGAGEPAADSCSPIHITGYRIGERLGSGGMGTVYRAHQLGTKRDVALKVMRADISQMLRSRQLFVQEVRLAAKLVHPNIVRIYDSGIDRDSYFYAMELIEGVTLDRFALLRGKDDSGKTRYTPCVPRRQVLALIEQICRCVHEAHLRGVIHRDLKPSNIMVAADGKPHVLDFGLATAVLKERIDEVSAGHDSPGAGVPRTADVIETPMAWGAKADAAGTPEFMSPEQSAGRPDDLDFRTDVYSIGATLFLLLTGRLPGDVSTGGHQTVLHNVAHAPLPAPREVDPTIDRELEALLLKSLARDRAMRYGTAAEMADDVARYLAGEPLRAMRPSLNYMMRKWLGRHRWSAAISTAVLGVVACLASYSWFSHRALQQMKDESAGFDRKWDDYTNQFNPEITGHSFDMRQMQNLRAASAVDEFRAHPDILARKLDASGVALVNSGYCADGKKWLKKAIDLKRGLGEVDAETLKMINDLAVAERELGQSANSIAVSRSVIADAQRLSRKHSDPAIAGLELCARDELALALGDQQRHEEELAEATAAYQLSKSLHPQDPDHPEVIRAENTLAFALRDDGGEENLDRARTYVEHAIGVRRARLGDTHPDTLRSKELLATIHFKSAGTVEELKNSGDEIDRITRTMVLDPSHPDVLRFKNDRSTILVEIKEFREAKELLESALREAQTRQMENLTTIRLSENLAFVCIAWADDLQKKDISPKEREPLRAEAETQLKAVINARNIADSMPDPALIEVKLRLATVLGLQGKYHDEQVLVEEILKIQQSRLGKNDPELMRLTKWLEDVRNRQRKTQ